MNTPLQKLETICDEIFERWDKDQRSGKLLSALAGRLTGYRADVDEVRASLVGVQRPEDVADLEAVADAIDAARYAHPDYPRERQRPFAEADRGDREYALRLARAAVAASPHTGQPQEGWGNMPPEWIEFYQKHQPTVAELQELINRFRRLPPDVRRLVVAARVVAYENQDAEALKELDEASEAFADRVPWKDEPSVAPASPRAEGECICERGHDRPYWTCPAHGYVTVDQ